MDDYQLEKLKNGKKAASDGWLYAIQRMDLLIISISGAGVWVVLETIKYAHDNHLPDVYLVKIAGAIFVGSMITNFISQWTGKNANLHHLLMCDTKIIAGDNPNSEQLAKIDKHDKTAALWDGWTDYFNLASMILMLTGLVVIMSYFLLTF